MRVLVCGSRTFADKGALSRTLNALPITAVIEGGAKGADSIAASWARFHGVEVEEFPAEWAVYGKRAGYVRNRQMLDEGSPDYVVAFVDKPLKESKGTAMMVTLAKSVGVPTCVVEP